MTRRFFLSFSASILFCSACEKEMADIGARTLHITATTPVPGCSWAPCGQAVAETKQAYQQLANSLCDTILVDIICCLDGRETYALVIVTPEPLACPQTSFSKPRVQ